jgi:hypothetical protein
VIHSNNFYAKKKNKKLRKKKIVKNAEKNNFDTIYKTLSRIFFKRLFHKQKYEKSHDLIR